MKLAPVVLFAYNRPIHTKKVLDSLALNQQATQTLLYIFCDGPKENASDDTIKQINEVRDIVNSEKRFHAVNIQVQSENLGLSKSIISGVTSIVEKHDKVIVLEDDILVGTGFLKYMNNALELYENEPQVGCIHGWNYSFKNLNDIKESTFFLKGADCWGWATWASSWRNFEANGTRLFNEIKKRKLEYSFDRNGTHGFTQMLQDQIDKKNDSWAIRWHASLFLRDIYCLHPTIPIVKNIGLDGSGTHCDENQSEQFYINEISIHKVKVQEAKWFFEKFELEFLFKKKLSPPKKHKLFKKIILKIKTQFINC
jgi:hypothetical protein